MTHGGKNLVANGAALQAELTRDVPLICKELGTPVLPWRLGTGNDLIALAKEGRRTAVRKLIPNYVRRSSYLRALSEEGAQRHDLDGRPIEPVSWEHRANAAERLKEHLAWKERVRKRAAKAARRAA